jgi:hypothetical protein
MTRSRVLIVGTLVLSVAVASNGLAQEPDQGAFVKGLVEAINSKSPDRRKALLHPTSLSCTSGEAGSFYEETVARQARRPVPADYKWKITPIPANEPLMFADQFDYPVRPTHLLQLDFETGPSSSTTMIVQLVHDANHWREVAVCPKLEVVRAARAAKEARAKHVKKVQALAARAPAPLRETVVKLFNEGRRIEAFKHYASATGEDLATAKAVVEVLAGHAR